MGLGSNMRWVSSIDKIDGARITNPNGAVRFIMIKIPETQKVTDIKGPIRPVEKIALENACASGLPEYSGGVNNPAITIKLCVPVIKNMSA